MGQVIASIDLGTNTALLLIAQRDGKNLKILHDEARITRLGEKLHDKKKFIPAAQKRVLQALKDYQKECNSLGVKKILAVGTAAFRKAKNASNFVARVKKETGIEIKIISGDEEARLSYLSAKNDFGSQYDNLYVLDIGGGSTELISKEGGVSFDLGAILLTESIVKHDPVTKGEFRGMEEKIDNVLSSPLRGEDKGGGDHGHPPLNPLPSREGKKVLIGLAGSVTTLSAIKQKLKVWDGTKVQGSKLSLGDLEPMIQDFQRMTLVEKSKIPGMVKGREDSILAGTLILKAVMKKLGVREVIVSDRGLRYGVIY